MQGVRPPDGRRSDFARATRTAIAMVMVAAVAGIGVAALLHRDVPPPQQGSGPTATPTRGRPSATPRSSLGATPAVGNIALPGSPELVLFQRQGNDLNVLGWRAGESALAGRQVIPGALDGITAQQDYATQLSPDGTIVLLQARPAIAGDPDVFRAFRLDGTLGRAIWESTTLGSGLAASFVGPRQVAVSAGAVLPTGRGWTIVDLSNDPVIHDVAPPPIPRPSPGASIDVETRTFNYMPLALSADGRWIYVLSVHAAEPLYRPAYRVAVETGEAQSMTAFPTTGPSRVVSPLIDQRSGRLLLAGPRLTSGPGLVEAWSSGAKTPDFRATFNTVLSAVWLDAGGVIAADYDRLPGPFTFRIVTLTATGKPAPTLFAAQGTDAALVGVQAGFAGAYVASRDAGVRTLIVIRLADGAIASVDVPEPSGLNFIVGLRR